MANLVYTSFGWNAEFLYTSPVDLTKFFFMPHAMESDNSKDFVYKTKPSLDANCTGLNK